LCATPWISEKWADRKHREVSPSRIRIRGARMQMTQVALDALFRILALMAGVLAGSALGYAESYPTRPVRVVVPFAPGGPTDVCARLIAQKLAERLGRQFYVENVAGAGGNIGTAQVAKSQPDGYTILVTVNSHVMNQFLYERLPFDPNKDFTPVSLAASFSAALVVNPTVAATTVSELVSLIRQGSTKYSFASPGVGTPSHLVGEQLRLALGLDIVHVPYSGGGPVVTSVVAGHTPMGFAGLSSVAPQARDGKLRVLALMSSRRSEIMPEVPTIAEAGYPGLDGDGWVGVFLPAGAPRAIVDVLNHEVRTIISLPDVKARLAALGFDGVGLSPKQFSERMTLEAGKWGKVVRAAGIRAN
jgi:tripartite-type tricarboxylate transporter receptor subunit TctC